MVGCTIYYATNNIVDVYNVAFAVCFDCVIETIVH